MSEKNLNFDLPIDRHNTNCLKYDFVCEYGKPQSVIPMWVADMDFRTSSEVLDALTCRVQHGIFGYSEATECYYNAVKFWMKSRHNWEVRKEWLIKTPGVVFALAMAVKAFTQKGDKVIIQQPVYYPFSDVINNNGRVVISSDLVLGEDGRYTVDFADFEQKIVENNVKLFILCSPHNPVGRVWEREELLRLGEICLKHNVKIVSDEIHNDFIFKGTEHFVFATLSKELEQNCVVCTSPGKTFNLAGLQDSNIFIPNEEMRKAFDAECKGAGYIQLNTMALTACEAAYRFGGEWYEGMMEYIQGNVAFAKEFVEKNLAPIKLIPSNGTYLLWMDFRPLNMTEGEREEFLMNQAGLWLDSGAIFGKAGEGFERFNIACPRATLKDALERLQLAVKNLLATRK